MKRIKTGSGITERTRVTYDCTSDDDMKALLKHMEFQIEKGALRSFPDRVRALEAMAADTLRSNNLPTREGLYTKVGDHWIENSGPRISACSLLAVVKREGHAEDSEAGYSARAICLIRFLNGAIMRGEVEQSAHLAFDLGCLLQENFMKLTWEKRAIHGEAMLPEPRNILDYNARRAPELAQERREWRAEADQIRAKSPGLKGQRLAELVKRNLGSDKSVRHICRYI